MSTTGTYTIKASGAAANDELYKLVYEDGTLTVSRRSSGGGGGSSSGSTGNVTGSGDDVNIDVSGGTVTTAQMEKAVDRADRGETITAIISIRRWYSPLTRPLLRSSPTTRPLMWATKFPPWARRTIP